MPRCLDPAEKIRLVLKSDAHLPEHEQPHFWFRALSGRRFRQAAALCEALGKQSEDKEKALAAIDGVYDVLRLGLVGWGHMVDRSADPPQPVPYDPADIDVVVDPAEAAELLQSMLGEMKLTADDKKKSA